MDENRSYFEDEEPMAVREPDREEQLLASSLDDEVPFHIPRD